MNYGGTGYKVLLLLHVLAVVTAFGPWFLNGLIPSAALKRTPAEGQAINAANFTVSSSTQYAIYAVVIFGFGLLGAKHSGFSMGKPWVGAALGAWIVIVGVLHAIVLPAQRALKDGTGDREALTQRQSLGVAIINVLVVVAIYLMIFKPGQ